MKSPILEKHEIGHEKLKSLFYEVRKMAQNLCHSSEDDADEICQRAMTKILKSQAVPRILSHRWLYVLTRNASFDYLRAKQKEARLVDRSIILDEARFDDEYGDSVCVPFVVCEDPEPDLYDELVQAVCRLPAQQRKAFVMFAAGKSYAQIAEATGCAVGTIRSRLHYAKRHLRAHLETTL
jgi:RNA polymerase sigma-70 factor, ECF subfamily